MWLQLLKNEFLSISQQNVTIEKRFPRGWWFPIITINNSQEVLALWIRLLMLSMYFYFCCWASWLLHKLKGHQLYLQDFDNAKYARSSPTNLQSFKLFMIQYNSTKLSSIVDIILLQLLHDSSQLSWTSCNTDVVVLDQSHSDTNCWKLWRTKLQKTKTIWAIVKLIKPKGLYWNFTREILQHSWFTIFPLF